MVQVVILQPLITVLLLASLVNGAITLKLAKHRVDARHLIERSQDLPSRSKSVNSAPRSNIANDKRSEQIQRTRSRPKRQDDDTWATFVALLGSLALSSSSTVSPSDTSATSSTTSSGDSVEVVSTTSATSTVPQVVVLGQTPSPSIVPSGPSTLDVVSAASVFPTSSAMSDQVRASTGASPDATTYSSSEPTLFSESSGSSPSSWAMDESESATNPSSEVTSYSATDASGSVASSSSEVTLYSPTTLYSSTVESSVEPITTESLSSASRSGSTASSSYSSEPSSGASAQASPSDAFPENSSVPLTNFENRNITYTIQVEVAGRAMNVIVDTGSSLFWVATQDCADCIASGMEVASMTLPADCPSATQYYGGGSVSGCQANADLRFGDFELQQHALLGVSGISESFGPQSAFMSGIIGVGMAHGNLIDGDPPLVTLFKRHMDQAPTVGFFLDPSSDDGDSEITLGDVTESAHVNAGSAVTLQRASVPSGKTDYGWYIVSIDKLAFGDLTLAGGGLALLDTGTTNLKMPQEQLSKIYEKLGGGNIHAMGDRYVLKCEKPSDAPDIVFTLGGRDWHVPYRDIIGSVEAENPSFCRSRLSALRDTSLYQYILGGVFLKNVYSSYNIMDGSVTLYDLVQQ